MQEKATLLSPPRPVDDERSLSETMEKRARFRTELQTLEIELKAEQNDADLGVPDARLRADKINSQVGAWRAEIERLSQKISTMQVEMRNTQVQQAELDAQARRRQLAECGASQVRLAAEAQQLSVALGDKLRELFANGIRLAGLRGTQEAARLFSFSALVTRVGNAAYRHFDRVPAGALTKLGHTGSAERFLQVVSHHAGADALDVPLPDAEQQAVDLVVREFLSLDDAVTARNRIDPTGRSLHVVQNDGIFILKPGTLQGAAARSSAGHNGHGGLPPATA